MFDPATILVIRKQDVLVLLFVRIGLAGVGLDAIRLTPVLGVDAVAELIFLIEIVGEIDDRPRILQDGRLGERRAGGEDERECQKTGGLHR